MTFKYSTLLGNRAKNVYKHFLESLNLPGDIAECGVYAGETSKELVKYLEENGINKILHMFDTFEGFPDIITEEEKILSTWEELGMGQYSCPVEDVIINMGTLTQYKIYKGLFSQTFPDFSEPLCFIHADADIYRSTIEIIHLADRLLVPGGYIIFDDYGNPRLPGVKLAIKRFLSNEKYDGKHLSNTIQYLAIKRQCDTLIENNNVRGNSNAKTIQ
jgi:O-methyltransferase